MRGQPTTKEESVHPWLLARMEEQGLRSMRALAMKCGLSYGTVANSFRLDHEIGIGRASRIAEALGVTLDELWRSGALPASVDKPENEKRLNR